MVVSPAGFQIPAIPSHNDISKQSFQLLVIGDDAIRAAFHTSRQYNNKDIQKISCWDLQYIKVGQNFLKYQERSEPENYHFQVRPKKFCKRVKLTFFSLSKSQGPKEGRERYDPGKVKKSKSLVTLIHAYSSIRQACRHKANSLLVMTVYTVCIRSAVFRGGNFKLAMEAQLLTSVNLSQLMPRPPRKWEFLTESIQTHQLTSDPSLSWLLKV